MAVNIALLLKGMSKAENYTHYGENAPHQIDYRRSWKGFLDKCIRSLRKQGASSVDTFLVTYDNGYAHTNDLIFDTQCRDYVTYDDIFRTHNFELPRAQYRLLTFMLKGIERIRDQERRSGVSYDYVILTRFDLVLMKDVDLKDFLQDKVVFGWIGDSGQSDDNWMVVPRLHMDPFIKALSYMRDNNIYTHVINHHFSNVVGRRDHEVCHYMQHLHKGCPEAYTVLRDVLDSAPRPVNDPYGIRIFYDGTNIRQFASHEFVRGFTTNTTMMKAAGIERYSDFLTENRYLIDGRPISLQVWGDDDESIYSQAKTIAALDHGVYVKIPVQTTSGQSNVPVIKRLLMEGVSVNVTAIFTRSQIDSVASVLHVSYKTPLILSVFAGRISDTGTDPIDTIAYAVQKVHAWPHAFVLWAGCKDNASILNAARVGCHIITLPDSIMQRIDRIGRSLDDIALATVQSFHEDAITGRITI